MGDDLSKQIKAAVSEIAYEPDGTADRTLLKLIADQFTHLPQDDPLRAFWTSHTMSWLHGNDGPSDLTRAANARYVATLNPSHKADQDIDLDW